MNERHDDDCVRLIVLHTTAARVCAIPTMKRLGTSMGEAERKLRKALQLRTANALSRITDNMDLHTINQTITDPAEWDGSLFGTQMELVQLKGSDFESSQTVTQLDGVQLLH